MNVAVNSAEEYHQNTDLLEQSSELEALEFSNEQECLQYQWMNYLLLSPVNQNHVLEKTHQC